MCSSLRCHSCEASGRAKCSPELTLLVAHCMYYVRCHPVRSLEYRFSPPFTQTMRHSVHYPHNDNFSGGPTAPRARDSALARTLFAATRPRHPRRPLRRAMLRRTRLRGCRRRLVPRGSLGRLGRLVVVACRAPRHASPQRARARGNEQGGHRRAQEERMRGGAGRAPTVGNRTRSCLNTCPAPPRPERCRAREGVRVEALARACAGHSAKAGCRFAHGPPPVRTDVARARGGGRRGCAL